MSVLFVILFIVVALVVIFWATRTRGNTTGPHVDTTMTAVGVVTEAVEELADTVKHAVKGEPEIQRGGGIAIDGGAPAVAPAATLKAAEPKPAVSKSAASKSKAPKAAAPKAEVTKAATPKTAARVGAPKTTPPKAAPKAAAPKAASKAAAPKPAASKPAARSAPDDLRQLKGVGPKLVTVLNGLGVTRFDQIAGWSKGDIATIDAQLGTFTGRITRDNWVEQAGFLAKGDIAGFEAKFGKLDSPGNS